MYKKYDKLVRSQIPEIIKKETKEIPFTHIANTAELRWRMEYKLIEEVAEYLKTKNVEELADVLEIVYAIADFKGFSPYDLEEIRVAKLNDHGGFSKGIILDYVESEK